MFSSVGRWAYRHRWRIIATWAVVVLAAAFLAPRAGSALKSNLGTVDTESSRALDVIRDELSLPSTIVIFVFESDTLSVEDPRFQSEVETTLEGIQELPEFVLLETYYSARRPSMVSASQDATYALAFFDIPVDDSIDRLPDIKAKVPEPETLTLWLTGAPSIFEELEETGRRDLLRAEIVALPLVLVALLIVFGGAVAASIPVIMGGSALILTLAVIFLLGQVIDLSIFAQNIASLLGLGVAVDYTLFLVFRFREELAYRSVEESIAVTMATAGKAIFFSGVTTVLGLSGLLVFELSFLRSIGLGGMVVVVLSLFLALTLVPAVLSVLGHRINALPILPATRGEGGAWRRLAGFVMRFPVRVLVPAGGALVLLGLPFLWVSFGPIWAGSLPEEAPARVGWDVASESFGDGELSPLLIPVTAPDSILAPAAVGALFDYTRDLAALDHVRRVESIVDLAPGIPRDLYQRAYADPSAIPFVEVREALNLVTSETTTLVRVYGERAVVSREARELVEEVRALEPGGGLTSLVGGATAGLEDVIDVLYGDFPLAVAVVLGSIYVTLLVLFRSLLLPLKAVILNSLSIFASFGALVFVFQDGRLEWLLNFGADGSVEATVPILLFCIVFGLSMDYEVFLLSRIKEEYDRTGDNVRSVAYGMQRSGRIITSAALVIVIVGSAFATSEIGIIKSLGFGLALAVFIDATIVRALLAPSIMRLLGRWNWWAPEALARWLPQEERISKKI